MKKLFKNTIFIFFLNLNLNLNLRFIFFFSFFSTVGGFHSPSQNLINYDPRLYEMMKGGKETNEIENLYNRSSSSS
jgi:hypothetical protein